MVGLRDWLPFEVTQESQNGLLCRTFGCDWRAGLSAARKFTNAQRLNECIIANALVEDCGPGNLLLAVAGFTPSAEQASDQQKQP
jgi:hypothetical protein